MLLLQEFGGSVRFSASWRQTYMRHCGFDHWTSEVRLHRSVCSDLLYQPFLCATTPLRSAWISRDNIPRIDAANLTPAKFRARFEQRNVPVIITGVVSCFSNAQHALPARCIARPTAGISLMRAP